MNLKIALTRAFIFSLFSVVCFGIVALMVANDWMIGDFDNTLIALIQGLESPALTLIMKGFTFIGSGVSIGIIMVIAAFYLYRVLRHRYELVLFVGVMLGTNLLNYCMKLMFQRARPVLHRIVDANGYSFPSGHSMLAFSLYGVLVFLLWRHAATRMGRAVLWIVAVVMIAGIGISRNFPVEIPQYLTFGHEETSCFSMPFVEPT